MSFKSVRDFRTSPARRPERDSSACSPWAVLLPDAAEGLLSDAEQRALDQHLAGCVACSEELACAQRGLAWLTVLKDQVPEPPVNLLAKILAETTGAAEVGVMLPPLTVVAAPTALPVAEPAAGWNQAPGLQRWFGFGQSAWASLIQPRLAMTGAMAFFSICLTLNLLGVSVSRIDGQTFRNGGIHRTVADTGASLVRSIEGLRMVYRVESRVSEMRAQMDGPDDTTSGH
ncbi:MAG TPA: zf-HC2 domain-containing protein [Acidobacteriaceae bacterium]|nr:zf-HC2 domain-containing protein [Acidobacteriaceae bacterium]